MALQPVAQTLDPSEFVVVPHIACLDTFRMTDETGGFVTDITPVYLDKFVAHMNERELATGDLAPIVIGHTITGLPEVDQPPVVGFARNWTRGTLGNTNRECAFADFWIKKQHVDQARNYPRRSCEVWATRYEADPISLLGATTPARDLGLMKLSREGSITFYPPGDMNMPDEPKKDDKKPDEKPADPKETGKAKGEEGKLDQVLSLLTQVLEKLSGGTPAAPDAAAACAPAAGAPAAAGAPGASGEMSDDEYNQLLQSLMAGEPADDKSRKQEPEPVKNMGQPGGTNTAVAKCSREEQEAQDREKIAKLETEVACMRIKDSLVKLQREGKDVDPEDVALINDLASMPLDMRNRQLDRMKQFNRAAPGQGSFHLESALSAASNGPQGKRIQSVEERDKLIKLARERNMEYTALLKAEGYDVN